MAHDHDPPADPVRPQEEDECGCGHDHHHHGHDHGHHHHHGHDAGDPLINPFRDVGRNDPCPCGSGRKFKKCCLQ